MVVDGVVVVIPIQVSICAGRVDERKVFGIRRWVMGAMDVVMRVGAIGQDALKRRGKYAVGLVPTAGCRFVYILVGGALLSYQVPVIFACPPGLSLIYVIKCAHLPCAISILYSIFVDGGMVDSDILINVVFWIRTVGGWEVI